MNNNRNNASRANPKPASVTNSVLANAEAITTAIDQVFEDLQSETENFASTLVKGFHDASSIFEEVLKMFESFSVGAGSTDGGGIFSSLLGLIPGGDIINGIMGLFGMGMPHYNAAEFNGSGAIDSAKDAMFTPPEQNHNITVVVNSEIESVKAVKFLKNYMPAYNMNVKQNSV